MASPPFNPNELLPADDGAVSIFPSQERTFRDIIESWLLIEHGRTGHHVFPILTTSERDAITDWEVGSILYNETLERLQVVTAIDADVFTSLGEFPSGFRTFAQQTSAPLGYTKESSSTYNNVAIRLTTGAVGTGGTKNFTDTLTARTILKANLPLYNLDVTDPGHTHNSLMGNTQTMQVDEPDVSGRVSGSTATGSATTGITVSSGGSGTAMDFAIKYADSIIIIKD